MGVQQRREREKQKRRKDILDAARSLFWKKGYDGTTMPAIARAAELAPGTLYLYFSNKDSLYLELLLEGYELMQRQLQQAVESETEPARRGEALIEAFFQFAREYPEYFDIIFFVIQIVAYVALPSLGSIMLFQIVMFLIMTCYGGGFASAPAYVSDIFGTHEVGVIYGYLLTAWAMAGLVGSRLIALIYKSTGRYDMALYIFAGMFCVVLIVSISLALQVKRIRSTLDEEAVLTTDEEDEALAVAEAE